AGGFNFFCGRSKMPLNLSFFLLGHFFAKDIFVFRVGLRKVIEAEALREFELAAAFRVAFYHHVDAPLDFGGRTLAAAAEVLIVLDLELPNVFFECRQFFVNGGHARGKTSSFNAKSM